MSLRNWIEAAFYIAGYFLITTLLTHCDHASAALLPPVAQERTMDRSFTEEEQQRLLDHLKLDACRDLYARRDAASTRALLHSGLRLGEFLQISVGQGMNALRTRYLFIPREHRKGHGKGAADDHMVYVTKPLREDLEELLRVRYLITEASCDQDDPLIISRLGRRLTVRAFELRFAGYRAAAGLPPNSSPHWLRHTRAQKIMRHSTAKDPRGVVKHALGHKSIASSGIYTETSRADVEAALNEIDGAAGRISVTQMRRAWEGRVEA